MILIELCAAGILQLSISALSPPCAVIFPFKIKLYMLYAQEHIIFLQLLLSQTKQKYTAYIFFLLYWCSYNSYTVFLHTFKLLFDGLSFHP